jgi:2,4'-dihydroxyacetophenone dioxygenase
MGINLVMFVGQSTSYCCVMSTSSTLGRVIHTSAQDWIPLGEGQSFKPIAFGPGSARQLLLRVESGSVVALHRHHGAVHAFTVSGRRVLLDPAGDIAIDAGSYVYEPAGNVDSWMAVGDEACVIHIAIDGPMDTLDDEGNVVSSSGTPELYACYLAWCGEHHVAPDPALV